MTPQRAPVVFVGRQAELARVAEATRHVHLAVVVGLGGIGKTAFALRAAEEIAGRGEARIAVHACRPGESIASVAAAILPGRRLADPLEALVGAATERPLVVCLDDAHRAGEGALLDAVTHLASLRVPLWLLVCSREALPISPAAVDHVVVRLGGLPAAEARAMWAALEALYGPAPAALASATLASGSPWLIKHAFAGPAARSSGDPLALSELPAIAGGMLSLTCALRRPAPRAILGQGQPDAVREQAIELLERRLLCERTEAGDAVTADALVREAVARSPLAPGPTEHHAALAWVRRARAASPLSEDLELDEIHHALEAGETDAAESLLLERASYLRRVMPMSAIVERELSSAVRRLAAARGERLPPALVSFGARIDNRQGRPAVALSAARPLAEAGDPLAALEAGEAALPLARFDEAVRWLERASAAEAIGPLAQLWATVVLIETHRTRGALDVASAVLGAAAPRFAAFGPLGACLEAWLTGVVAHDGERYAAAVEALGRARRALAAAPEIPATTPLLASLERAAAAGAGHDELPGAEPSELWDETLFYRMGARILRGQERALRGRTAEATALAEAAAELARAGEYHNVSAWGAWIRGEASRAEGRPEELAVHLQEAARAARQHGNARTAVRIEQVRARCLLDLGRAGEARAQAVASLADARFMPGTRARLEAIVELADALEHGLAASGRGAGRSAANDRAERTEHAEGWDEADAGLLAAEALLLRGAFEEAARRAAAAETAAARAGWAQLTCRARLLAAEASLAVGDVATARSAWHAARRDAEQAGWQVELAQAGLLGAALARAAGDGAEAATLLAEAAERAERCGLALHAAAARFGASQLDASAARAPLDAAPAAVRLAGRFGLDAPAAVRVRRPSGELSLSGGQVDRLRFDDHTFVIDLMRGTVRVGRRRAQLGKRPALVDLLRVLGRTPGQNVSVEQLVADAWGLSYHPVRHHSRVTMAISRLRSLLGKGAVIGGRDGYALATRGDWAVIEPVSPGPLPEAPARAGATAPRRSRPGRGRHRGGGADRRRTLR